MSWASLSQAARDAAYDNVAAVANSAELIAEGRAAAAPYRAARTGHLDLPYGPREREKWDLYPSADPQTPCLVFIHGGYWQKNTREDFAHLGAGVAAHGWSVAMPGYTLAPEASLTEIAAEMIASLDWLAAHRAAHGISGKIVLSGWSAGAHLAVLAMAHDLVSAALLISGAYELGPIRDTYLNEKLQLTEAEIVALSPLRLPVVQKPTVITYGTVELAALVDDSKKLHEKRLAAHAPSTLLPIEGADHFTIGLPLQDPNGALIKAILGLVK
ncbi:alpha/beta hydrolase [Acidocella sp.]|uniref:alpha/beta hydrolase n=1 Tax=Acidocella sp. TaxID=50710 RepID=UPI002F3F2408